MEPLFTRPVMAHYFATRSQREHHVAENTLLNPAASHVARRSLTTTVRLTAGALLIAAGERLAGIPRPATNTAAS